AVTGLGERMRSRQIDGLLGEQVNGGRIGCRDGVVRQMRMEIERLYAFEPAACIEVAVLHERLQLFGSLDGGWTQSVLIVNWHTGQVSTRQLDTEQRQVEHFERAGDALQRRLRRVLTGLIRRPGHPTHFGDGGEAIVHLRDVAVRLPRVTPGPVDAEAPLAWRVRARNLDLVVCAWTGLRSHDPGSALPLARNRSALIPGRKNYAPPRIV